MEDPIKMADQKEIHPANPAETAGTRPADAERIATRRRLLKAGVVAAPMLLTLRGRPARAQQQQQSLGSLGVFYGAYVTQEMVDDGWFEDADLGKSIVPTENDMTTTKSTSKGKGKGKSPSSSTSTESPWKLDPNGNDRRK